MSNDSGRAWLAQPLQQIGADVRRSADSHLNPLSLPEAQGVDVSFKDESTHPPASLKHRLARLLFMDVLGNGLITPQAGAAGRWLTDAGAWRRGPAAKPATAGPARQKSRRPAGGPPAWPMSRLAGRSGHAG